MKQNELRFGEKHHDYLYGNNLPTEWGPKYEGARTAADAVIREFGLAESDFWIKKEMGPFSDKIIYANLILSHSGCIKINKQQPPEKKFRPSCVSECKGTRDGGVALLYQSDEQGILKTGEASPMNSSVSYLYAVAEKRLFDRVVVALSGLYEEGVYGEGEAETFTKKESSVPDKESGYSRQSVFAEQDPREPVQALYSQETQSLQSDRIRKLEDGIRYTNSDLKKMLDFYGVFSLEELDEASLSDAEEKIGRKVRNRKAAIEAAKAAPQNVQHPVSQAMPPQSDSQGLSPVAQIMMAQVNNNAQVMPHEEASPVRTEIPIDQTVYTCLDGAPENFRALCGKTLEQIGKDTLKPLFGRKNSVGRRWISEEMLAAICRYIAA